MQAWLPDSPGSRGEALGSLTLSPPTGPPTPPSSPALDHGPQRRTWPVGEPVLPGLLVTGSSDGASRLCFTTSASHSISSPWAGERPADAGLAQAQSHPTAGPEN